MLDTKYTRQQHAKNTSLEYLSEYFSLKSAENKNIQLQPDKSTFL